MKAIRYHEHGDADVLTMDDVLEPTPGPEEVTVRVHAAGVNPIDTYVREGNVSPEDGLPHIGGADVAGVVEEAGEGADAFEPGDRVFATGLGLFEPGTYAEYVSVSESKLAPLPESVSFEEGAAAAMAFATAWRGLVTRGDLSVGDVCLVQGGSGGVGHAGVQIARHAGATVVATAREGEPAEMVRELGADAVVDYRADDLPTEIREATGGDPVDVVLEPHAASNLVDDLDVLVRSGRITLIGEDEEIRIPPGAAMTGKIADADLRFMSIMASTDDQGPILRSVAPLLGDGTFEARIAKTYPLSEAPAAQRDVLSGGTLGKIVLEVT
ncbi:NADPH:quinone reductase [Salinibaculum rarum]|uniref:NADPH:quinone reductase n=1 Tax=Salinibaculum rarum TaxID=3058903 RepID=UPI0026602EE4|nr:NADPH:quinone reductase [Salinibaculum sp. KK48]